MKTTLRCKKRKHLPRKFNQVNILRALVLNINDGIDIDPKDFKLSNADIEAFYDSLVRSNFIMQKKNTKPYICSSYMILDPIKFEKIKGNLYCFIEKCVLPCLTILLSSISIIK